MVQVTVLLVILCAGLAASVPTAQPVAPAGATVIFDRARFTVLTAALIRMELRFPNTTAPPRKGSADSGFDDRATFAVINRRTPVLPSFTTSYPDPDTLSIATDALRLTFRRPGPRVLNFTSDNLSIDFTVAGKPAVWTPGMVDPHNLNGTCDMGPNWVGGLDCYSTPAACVQRYNQLYGPGLISRSGWSLHDDTNTTRLQSEDPKPGELRWFDRSMHSPLRVSQDLYFLGHGHDYVLALQDWSLVSGSIAMPPQSAFGVWWSRYYSYSDQQFLKEVLVPYKQNGLPLNHVVLDMGWHIDGWGGYTFNSSLFPNPERWISYIHSETNVVETSLKLLLNLHPQTGVDHTQAMYPQVARAMGIDPATQDTVACQYDNQTYSDVMFDLVMDAEPLSGVDYWWTDYGGCSTLFDVYQAQFWTNYNFIEHVNTVGKKRPLLLSRYGGLGSQRMPIGFSGDTFQDYGTLEYEIQMTPTASNVLFAYWSHDIGGNHDGTDCPGTGNPDDPLGSELLLRWLQFAAVSPIWRTHCGCYRYFWDFSYFDLMKQAFLLRNALGPYIYTSVRQAYDTAVGLLHPLYYEWPELDEAYSYRDQYMFGPHVLAAPISAPADPSTSRVRKDVWLPPGRWVSWDGITVYEGPVVLSREWTRAEIPMFVRAGAVIPTKTMASVGATSPDPLVWVVYLQGSQRNGAGEVYEDDGVSTDYVNQPGARTELAYHTTTVGGLASSQTTFTISPMTNSYAGMPTSRGHVLQLRGVAADSRNSSQLPQSVTCNGQVVPPAKRGVVPGWYVSSNATSPLVEPAGSLVVELGQFSVRDSVVVHLYW